MANKRLLFLCSGGGGNLRFVHQAIKRGWLADWQIVAVITDRECPASEYARREGIPVNCQDFAADQQVALLQHATSCAPDMVITTVNRILGEAFVRAFEGKLLNLHYSLLPAFAGSIGASPVKAALAYGVRLGGATVHQVTEVLDGGCPQAQIAFPVAPEDDIDQVMDVEFRAGCVALLAAMHTYARAGGSGSEGMALTIKSRHALLNPCAPLPEGLFEESFWLSLK